MGIHPQRLPPPNLAQDKYPYQRETMSQTLFSLKRFFFRSTRPFPGVFGDSLVHFGFSGGIMSITMQVVSSLNHFDSTASCKQYTSKEQYN
jgi:hypothetical protein